MTRFWTLCTCILILVVADQATKDAIVQSLQWGETRTVIPGFFSLAYVRNSGAAFGFLRDGALIWRQILFLALPVAFCGWIAVMFFRTIKGSMLMSTAYALILAGATGNLIDRFRLGYVVDFLMFYWKTEENHFHVFNIADSCISVAAALLLYDYFRQWKTKRNTASVQPV